MSDEVENEFNDSISISHDDAQTDFGSKHTIRKKRKKEGAKGGKRERESLER
jgi:hypothetical protein